MLFVFYLPNTQQFFQPCHFLHTSQETMLVLFCVKLNCTQKKTNQKGKDLDC